MKKQILFIGLLFIGFIELVNAQESNYCAINNIRMTASKAMLSCKYCNFNQETDIHLPSTINKDDLSNYDLCEILNNPDSNIAVEKKCFFNSLVLYLTAYHFVLWYMGNSYTHDKCNGKYNPGNTHVITMEYLKQEEETNSFSEQDIEAFKNLTRKWGATIDHESYLEGMRNSTQSAIAILKKSCN